jgi:hypothetical protein
MAACRNFNVVLAGREDINQEARDSYKELADRCGGRPALPCPALACLPACFATPVPGGDCRASRCGWLTDSWLAGAVCRIVALKEPELVAQVEALIAELPVDAAQEPPQQQAL